MKSYKIKSVVVFIFIFMALMAVGGTVWAQTNYVPLAPLPEAAPEGGTNMIIYLTGMVKLLIGVAGVLAVIMIMIGGIQYMSSDAITGKEEGKEKITQALFGLILAIASWLILNTINPNLLIIKPNVPPAELPPPPTEPPPGP